MKKIKFTSFFLQVFCIINIFNSQVSANSYNNLLNTNNHSNVSKSPMLNNTPLIMNHSFSVTNSYFNGQSISYNTYSNRSFYKINSKLGLNMGFNIINNNLMINQPSNIMFDLEMGLQYQLNEKSIINIQISRINNPSLLNISNF